MILCFLGKQFGYLRLRRPNLDTFPIVIISPPSTAQAQPTQQNMYTRLRPTHSFVRRYSALNSSNLSEKTAETSVRATPSASVSERSSSQQSRSPFHKSVVAKRAAKDARRIVATSEGFRPSPPQGGGLEGSARTRCIRRFLYFEALQNLIAVPRPYIVNSRLAPPPRVSRVTPPIQRMPTYELAASNSENIDSTYSKARDWSLAPAQAYYPRAQSSGVVLPRVPSVW